MLAKVGIGMRDRRRLIAQLFLSFVKIGAFTFGGGYAMIPLIQREAVEKRGWLDAEEMPDLVALAESTPGPIAINAATFIGYRTAGLPGAVCATLGVVLPSFLIILLLSKLLLTFADLRPVRYAFAGVRAGVLALILRALWIMFRQVPKKWFSCLVMAAAFVLTALLKLPAVPVLAGCALAGLVYSLIAARRQKR